MMAHLLSKHMQDYHHDVAEGSGRPGPGRGSRRGSENILRRREREQRAGMLQGEDPGVGDALRTCLSSRCAPSRRTVVGELPVRC